MFFFFVGGIQPRIRKILQSNYGPCLSCHVGVMDHVELDNVLELFWIPIWTLSSKSLLYCSSCQWMTSLEQYHGDRFATTGRTFPHPHGRQPTLPNRIPSAPITNNDLTVSCPSCGERISAQWNFCPKCGIELWHSIRTLLRLTARGICKKE